ncbi:MAG TPA: ribonuclease R [Stellaceae bacterium]|nr:ribonuclease R [Stellaceae bacterium]
MPRSGSPRGRSPLPSAAALIEFLRDQPEPVSRNEIARAFRLAPSDLPALRDRLQAIERTGSLRRLDDHRWAAGPPLPEAALVEGAGSDEDGLPFVRPVEWPDAGAAPTFQLEPDAELAVGARAMARLVRRDSGEVEAQLIRRIEAAGQRVVGVFETARDGGRLVPSDRRNRIEYRVAARDTAGALPGELVAAEVAPARRFGAPQARIVERLGAADAPGAVSRIAIASFDIPTEFPAAALAEAAAAAPVALEGRDDLRGLALVTIDGPDARDFDDAVWAEPDADPANPDGWHIVVAIADVAWYVRPNGALDREALRRGNSVYFPDRVVPMLPEALSNGLCSLKPDEDRACLAAHLWIDARGHKRRHRFVRGLMRSAARLTYEEVQAARDMERALPIATDRLAALYGAFGALDRARRERGALELDLVERRVLLDGGGQPTAIVPRPRLDSHRLIEEFMILANVAAAEELEARRRSFPYRVHDAPAPEKLAELHDFVESLGVAGLSFPKGAAPKPALFNHLLRRVEGAPQAPLVNELVLRAQAQAVYSPDNIGHFGLALRRYCHFTSPIRRYADLLVHRALLGEIPGDADLAAVAAHISATERRAVAAERAALDRYAAMLLSRSVGAAFPARISGVADFGLFVTLDDSGADGLVPISTLPSDYYRRDDSGHRLVGRHSRRVYRLGDAVVARLAEADAAGGRLVFRLEGPDRSEEPGDAPRRRGQFGRRTARNRKGRGSRR